MTDVKAAVPLTNTKGKFFRESSSKLSKDLPPKKRTSGGNVKKSGKRKRSVEVVKTFPEEYEVEKILKHSKTGDKVESYYVKWKGWPVEDSTWEPLDNLRASLALVAEYHQNRIYPGQGELVFNSQMESLRMTLSQLNDDVIDLFCTKYLTDRGHTIAVDEEEVNEQLSILSRIPAFARDSKMVENVQKNLQLIEFRKKREKQLVILLSWETEVNQISTDAAPITLCNNNDLDVISPNFRYVNNNIPDSDVEIPDNNPVLCECTDFCFGKNCCWNGVSSESPYTKAGLLKFPKGTPIFECNKWCKCGPNCGNRVLQNGRNVPVAIFKTPNGCGWGVRTLVDVKKGQFVTEYLGEVITSEVAEIRGRNYDKNGCTYLFDLDFNDQTECPYTVDAAVYGNVAHFINHSCSPNLEVFAVWVDCIDRNLPRLGLYAARNIKAFEELSFDYMIEKPVSSKKRDPEKQIFCQCNSKNCRKIVF